jgi:tartrate-resistant acid phosphatase type 5
MIHQPRLPRRTLVARSTAILGLVLLAGCASAGPRDGYKPFSLLLFGDHGYQLDYLEAKDKEPARTLDQAIAAERVEWAEDHLPPEEFTASAMIQLPSTGGYVPASGMMPVARAMADYCKTAPCDAAVMLGDNVYPNGPTGGADGVSDAKRFEDIFKAPYGGYTALGPDFRIYATLGNHDWRTSREAAMAEVRYLETTPPFYMDGIAYRVKPPAGKGEVEIFVIDTEVLLAGAEVYKAELAPDGSPLPRGKLVTPKPWTVPATEQERGMAQWLEQSLKSSTARWKIVIGHHPLWSSAGSKFEQARTLRELILPSLCQYADMYIAGHEHTLEVHTDSCATAVPGKVLTPLPQFVSGAAAKQRPVNSWFAAHQAKESPQLATFYVKGQIWGYMHLSLAADQAVVTVITTPTDGRGGNVPEFTRAFPRRSGTKP